MITNHLISEMESTGPNGLSVDKQVNLPEAYSKLNGDTVLIGNIDPVTVITFEDPETIREKSTEMVKGMEGKKNFIFSTGCDVPQDAPIENLKAMLSVRNI